MFKQQRKDREKEFSETVKNYSDRIYRIIYRMTEKHEDILDIMQNAFYKAYRNLDNFRGDSSMYTYLVSIAVNEARTYLQKEKPSLFIEFDEASGRYHSEDRNREKLHAKSVREKLEKALLKLPLQYREIIILRDYEQLSTKEAAIITKLSENGVKTRLRRARMLLKELLEDEGF